MGYTHYWNLKGFTEEQFTKFVEICKKLSENLPDTTNTAGGYCSDSKLRIGGNEYGEKAEFSKNVVFFNGQAPKGDKNKNDAYSHETFLIAKDDNGFGFCKTARKPYDLLVTACLVAAHSILGCKVSSDGDIEEWKEGINFYKKTIGSVHFKLKND